MKKLQIGLFFGGRSVEHEVSVITALQAYEHLEKSKYQVVPIYISKAGNFYTNPKLLDLKNYQDIDGLLLSSSQITLGVKNGVAGFYTQGLFPKFTPLDLAFPLFHGSFGEDGSIQGTFEMYQLPYVGFGVMGSAVAMDKIISKTIFQSIGLQVGKFVAISRHEWIADQARCLKLVKENLAYPVFVKPATGGSSIGTNKAKDEEELAFNIEVAAIYSDKVLIEEAFAGVAEVNCSAIGYGGEVQASVCEMPVSSGDLLSFDDKYKKGGKGSPSAGSGLKSSGMASLSRIIPAPISPKLAKDIQRATIDIFKAFDGCGVARVDYFVDPQKEIFWANEVNSPPGSLSFYLWEPTGIPYQDLLDKLINFALRRAEDQKKTQYTFESGLLSAMAMGGGLKGKSS